MVLGICFFYLKFHQWNDIKCGELICYTTLFGRGKTLSVVHYVVNRYLKYNDKKIYDRTHKKWVVQKVYIISNVHLIGAMVKLLLVHLS